MPKDAFKYPVQLMKMFPTIEGDVVVAVLESVNQDFNMAVQALMEMSDVNPVYPTTAEEIPPQILVEMTSTPIDQLLQDEMFAIALQKALNEEQAQQSSSSLPSPTQSKRPSSASSTVSSLKSKWNNISEKTKQKAAQLYSKMKTGRKSPQTPLRGNFMFVDDDNDDGEPDDYQDDRLAKIKSLYPQVQADESTAPSMNTIQRPVVQRRTEWPEEQPRQMPLQPTLIIADQFTSVQPTLVMSDQFENASLRAKSKSPEKPLIDFDD